MFAVVRESAYFTRSQFQPLLQIALIYTLPSLLLELGLLLSGSKLEGIAQPLASGTLLSLGVVQFAAAIFYIDHLVAGTPIGIGQAVTRALARLGPLLMVNLIMGALVFGGLMLLVVPGLFFAYKLLFAEFYLLLRGQDPIASLKSSYRATSGLAAELLPPLLIWAGALLVVGVGLNLGAGEAGPDAGIILLEHLLSACLSMWGWALIYRLYQKHLCEKAPGSAER